MMVPLQNGVVGRIVVYLVRGFGIIVVHLVQGSGWIAVLWYWALKIEL